MTAAEYSTPLWPSPPAPETIVCALVIEGAAVPKSRARVVRGHAFTPQRTKDWQEFVGWSVRKAYPGLVPNATHNLGVALVFLTANNRPGDVDNLTKSILDGCNKIVWADDSQVVQIVAQLERSSAAPCVHLCVYTVGASRVKPCENCGVAMHPTWDRGTRFCSKVCYDEAQRKGRYVYCSTFGARVYRQNEKLDKSRGHFFCSPECKRLARNQQVRCKQCGQPFQVYKRPGSIAQGGDPAPTLRAFVLCAAGQQARADRSVAPPVSPGGGRPQPCGCVGMATRSTRRTPTSAKGPRRSSTAGCARRQSARRWLRPTDNDRPRDFADVLTVLTREG